MGMANKEEELEKCGRPGKVTTVGGGEQESGRSE
jgi:hypothetical protein